MASKGCSTGWIKLLSLTSMPRSPTKNLSACVSVEVEDRLGADVHDGLDCDDRPWSAEDLARLCRVLGTQYATPGDWSLLDLGQAEYDRDRSVEGMQAGMCTLRR